MKRDYAVTPIIGLVLILTIVTIVIASILLWAVPYMNRQREISQYNSMVNQFTYLNMLIGDIVKCGENATREMTFIMKKGTIEFSNESDMIVISYSLQNDLNFSLANIEDRDESFTVNWKEGNLKGSINITWLDTGHTYNDVFSVSGTTSIDISTPYDLKGSVRIDFRDDAGSLAARAWLFDMGCLSFEIISSNGLLGVYEESNSVIRCFREYGFFVSNPFVYYGDGKCMLRIVQLTSEEKIYESTTMGGEIKIGLTAVLNKSRILEIDKDVYNFRYKFYGKFNETWEEYIKNKGLQPYTNELRINLVWVVIELEERRL